MSNSEGYRVGLRTTSFRFWSLFDFKREPRRVALYHSRMPGSNSWKRLSPHRCQLSNQNRLKATKRRTRNRASREPIVLPGRGADRRGPIALSNPMRREHPSEKSRTEKGSCSRLPGSLFVPATSSPFCSNTRSTGEPRTVPSLFPLRREGPELNKDCG
jgi:hypothetical protein